MVAAAAAAAVTHPDKPDFLTFLAGADAWVQTLAGRIARQFRIDVEDARQELVLHMLRLYDGYDPARGAPTTWTALRAKSLAGWWRRRNSFKGREQGNSVGTLYHADGEQLDVADPRAGDPADLAAGRDDVARLTRGLGRLRPRDREVLARRYGLAGERPESLESVGRRLGVTREAVRQIEDVATERLADEVLEW